MIKRKQYFSIPDLKWTEVYTGVAEKHTADAGGRTYVIHGWDNGERTGKVYNGNIFDASDDPGDEVYYRVCSDVSTLGEAKRRCQEHFRSVMEITLQPEPLVMNAWVYVATVAVMTISILVTLAII